jgi:phage baseplate assembly protein gpV
VIDPEPGDIGLAVFTKVDSSNVGQGAETAVQPGSLRTFDEGNGFYVSAFLNKAPEIYVELNKEGEINIKGKATIKIETEGDINIEAGGALTFKAASVSVTGGITAGDITAETVTGNGVVLDTHTHTETNAGSTLQPDK